MSRLKVNQISVEEVVHEARTLYKQWPKLDTDRKRTIVETVFGRIEIKDGENGGTKIALTYSGLASSEELCKNQQQMGQLLGIAQRTVEAVFGDFKQRYSTRKLIPSQVKTLSNQLLLERIKANLSQSELAVKTGFTVRRIKKWEHDRLIPTEAEWKRLARILDLKTAMGLTT